LCWFSFENESGGDVGVGEEITGGGNGGDGKPLSGGSGIAAFTVSQ
jgi:hypothetical protein